VNSENIGLKNPEAPANGCIIQPRNPPRWPQKLNGLRLPIAAAVRNAAANRQPSRERFP
jgi:hypothetical protein